MKMPKAWKWHRQASWILQGDLDLPSLHRQPLRSIGQPCGR